MRGFSHSAEFETVLGAFVSLGKSGVLRRFEAMTMDKGSARDCVISSVRCRANPEEDWRSATRLLPTRGNFGERPAKDELCRYASRIEASPGRCLELEVECGQATKNWRLPCKSRNRSSFFRCDSMAGVGR